MSTEAPADPARLLDTLDADAIQRRLDELTREARALRVLLRSARARQRAVRSRSECREEMRRAD
jgi:hypothetical protein